MHRRFGGFLRHKGWFRQRLATPASAHLWRSTRQLRPVSPKALCALQYEPPGARYLADEIVALLTKAGLPAALDAQRGLDHGAWVPLRYFKPAAELPVVQVSLPQDINAEDALRLGQALEPLRDRGVLIVGAGSLTHHLYPLRSLQATCAMLRPFAVSLAGWQGIRHASPGNPI